MLCSQFRDSLAHDSVGKPYRPPTICPLISAKVAMIHFICNLKVVVKLKRDGQHESG